MSEIRITFLGTKGGPAIHPGSAMPTAFLLQIEDRVILVDAGLGVTRAICDAGVALTDLDLIIITHLHSDHYLELGPLLHTAWVAGLDHTIPIIGPSGLADYWTHFCAAMAFDIELRQSDEGRCAFQPLADLQTISEGRIHEDPLVVIDAMRNDHPPITESFALRIKAGGKTIILSGDTAPMAAMAVFAKGADLLVHEAMLREGVDALCARLPNRGDRLRHHILRSHTSAEDAGRIAQDAGVGALALHHFVPDRSKGANDAAWIGAVRKHWPGPLWLAEDGLTVTV